MEEHSNINEEIVSSNEDVVNDITETQSVNEDIVEMDKSIQKPKKPRSQAQIDALKKAQETRRKNLLMKKEQLKALKENEGEVLEKAEVKPVSRPRKKKPVVVYEDDPSSDEEVIVVKRKPRKRKPRKKKIIVEESESSDEEIIIQKPTKKLQKQKSVKIVESEDESDDSDSDYEIDKAYSYPINRPLKYSDVFRFA